MRNIENLSFHDPADPVLVLLDTSFRAVSFNAEAIQVLGYPQNPRGRASSRLIEARLSVLLSPLRSSPRATLASTFHSGGRQYNVRLFNLNRSEDVSSSGPAYALMLERPDRRPVDLSSAINLFHLTPRERETLQFLMQGMTSKEIANHMGVSPHTVKAFLRLVMGKMQVSTRSGIIGKLIVPGIQNS
jgi:DNA-binding CsgD family transcriptional regulator